MVEQVSMSAGFKRPQANAVGDRQQTSSLKKWLFVIATATVTLAPGTHAHAQQPFVECRDEFWNGEPPEAVSNGAVDALCNTHFATLYSEQTETPLYSAEHLTPTQIEAAIHLRRDNAFHRDARIPNAAASTLEDYWHSGYDRGHMAPSGDEPDAASRFQSFALSNIVPQNWNDNRYLWADIEFAVRELVLVGGDDVYVVTGPIFEDDDPPPLSGRVQVPALLFKAVYDPASGIAGVYVARNATGHVYWSLSLDRFAALYGIRPFPGLTGSLTTVSGVLPPPAADRVSQGR